MQLTGPLSQLGDGPDVQSRVLPVDHDVAADQHDVPLPPGRLHRGRGFDEADHVLDSRCGQRRHSSIHLSIYDAPARTQDGAAAPPLPHPNG